jgi:hypothetical protein
MTSREIKEKVISSMLVRLTFDGSFQRSKIYSSKASAKDKKKFRDFMASELQQFLKNIEKQGSYSDNKHYNAIHNFSNFITNKFSPILFRKRFRIGTAQKFINLYWKVAWILGKTTRQPIHCPFDSVVIKQLPGEITTRFTQCDILDEYRELVEAAREAAGKHRSIAEWEADIYFNTINGNVIGKRVFIRRLRELPELIVSKTGNAKYGQFSIKSGILNFYRVNTGKLWQLNIDELYEVYKSNSFINTSTIKKATNGRTNSPSLGILMSIGCIDEQGNRI